MTDFALSQGCKKKKNKEAYLALDLLYRGINNTNNSISVRFALPNPALRARYPWLGVTMRILVFACTWGESYYSGQIRGQYQAVFFFNFLFFLFNFFWLLQLTKSMLCCISFLGVSSGLFVN